MLALAHELAVKSREMQHIAPVAIAQAEAAWLSGDDTACAQVVQSVLQLTNAQSNSNPWDFGALAFWAWRSGLISPKGEFAEPYTLQIAGNWRAAAVTWERIGSPFEQAMALVDGDGGAQLRALAIFEALGARPAVDRVRLQLRRAGVRNIPRGKRATTRRNPAGLTNRELDVLYLLAENASNDEVAHRLSISVKTVEHHVSTVIHKLNCHRRGQAISRAHRLGILPAEDNLIS